MEIQTQQFLSGKEKRKQIWLDRLYETAAQIALKYGKFGNRYNNCNMCRIKEFWKFDAPYPSCAQLENLTHVKNVKWYIHNKLICQNEIWNSDFLQGLAMHGQIKWNKMRFPTFICNKKEALDIIKTSPFGGELHENKNGISCRWSYVPAFYLKYDEDSISFMAGVMSAAQIIIKNEISYALFDKNIKQYLDKWKIPIEEYTKRGDLLISPIWVALLTYKMPIEIREKWLNIENPCNANLYAAVLWKTYIDSNFERAKIPYLKSRRQIMYNFECEEGAMRRLDMLRMEKGLTELDGRIKEAVKTWKTMKE